MKEKDKWAINFSNSFLVRYPGLEKEQFEQIWQMGFSFAKEKMLDLADCKHQVVSFTEINRLGEKSIGVKSES